MNIITNNKLKNNFILTYSVNQYGNQFLDVDLPIPTILTNYYRNDTYCGYRLSYLIDGYFGTKKGFEYLSDVDIKIQFALNNKHVEWEFFHRDTKYLINEYSHVYENNIYQLSDFQHLEKPLITKKQREIITTGLQDSFFDIARFRVYTDKQNDVLSYERALYHFEEINEQYFNNKYSLSDIRAKAKSTYEWTKKYYTGVNGSFEEYKQHRREYIKLKARKHREEKRQIKINEGTYMTRTEAAKVASNNKAIEAKTKIQTAINILKKYNEKITMADIAREAKVSRHTVYKYRDLLVI